VRCVPDALLVTNIGELATLRGGPRAGAAMRDIGLEHDRAVYIEDGMITEIGPSRRMDDAIPNDVARVNAGGRAVVPGFCDPHTHAVYGGDRVDEFVMKIEGASYEEILHAGGGILHTVRLTRGATRAELLKSLLSRVGLMLEHGTTTAEVKSGYGLDLESERLQLEAIRMADERIPVDLVPTLCAAHALAPEFDDSTAYADHVIAHMTDSLADLAEFVDVWCERGIFSVEDSRRVLEAGVRAGLRAKIHADELALSGGSMLAAEMRAVSADHLLHAGPEQWRALAAADVTAVLLPATAFALKAKYADARGMIESGCRVALATDNNPNCPTPSMPFIIALACYQMNMTPAEALCAATTNAAAALGRDDRGTIEAGQLGDVVILDAPNHRHLGYRFGMNPVWKVIKMGEVVVDRSERRR